MKHGFFVLLLDYYQHTPARTSAAMLTISQIKCDPPDIPAFLPYPPNVTQKKSFFHFFPVLFTLLKLATEKAFTACHLRAPYFITFKMCGYENR
jgi:hypothetical protein